jgi:hypothetical protein
MQQFRHITTSYTICRPGHQHTPWCQWGKAFPIEVIEWIGTGLAIQHLNHPTQPQEYYGLVHVPSGRLLIGSTTPSLVEAALWLRYLKDVTDWTQPSESLQESEELQTIVHAMREQAFRRYNQMRGKKIIDYDYASSHTSEGYIKE